MTTIIEDDDLQILDFRTANVIRKTAGMRLSPATATAPAPAVILEDEIAVMESNRNTGASNMGMVIGEDDSDDDLVVLEGPPGCEIPEDDEDVVILDRMTKKEEDDDLEMMEVIDVESGSRGMVYDNGEDPDVNLELEITATRKLEEDEKPLIFKREQDQDIKYAPREPKRRQVPKFTIPHILPDIQQTDTSIVYEFDLGEEAALVLDYIKYTVTDDKRYEVRFYDQRETLLAEGLYELPDEFLSESSHSEEHIGHVVRIIYSKF